MRPLRRATAGPTTVSALCAVQACPGRRARKMPCIFRGCPDYDYRAVRRYYSCVYAYSQTGSGVAAAERWKQFRPPAVRGTACRCNGVLAVHRCGACCEPRRILHGVGAGNWPLRFATNRCLDECRCLAFVLPARYRLSGSGGRPSRGGRWRWPADSSLGSRGGHNSEPGFGCTAALGHDPVLR